MGAARKLYVADLFCGAGGTSRGLAIACERLKYQVELLAINHWPVAIATHKKNHPWARHMCARIQDVDPRLAIPGGHLDLLVASPECRWYSKARGGRAVNDQGRVTAWRILEWLDALHVSNVLIENVEEFEDWAPLNVETGRPIKAKRGTIFTKFIEMLEAMNYRVEWRVLNAADFGAATTRRRLFIIARKGCRKIAWPAPSHSKDAGKTKDLFLKLKPWRAAREIIDWTIEGTSIFTRKKPLARTTLERIAAGLRKFCGPSAEPFLRLLEDYIASLDGPRLVDLVESSIEVVESEIVEATGTGLQPFLTMLYGTGRSRSIERPLPTVTASGNHIALCEAFILQQQSGGAPRAVSQPLPTISTAGAQALVRPYLIPFFGERNGQKPRAHDLDLPLPAVTGHGAGALVEPFIITPGGADLGIGRPVSSPLPTVLGHERFALVDPFVVNMKGRSTASAIGLPLPTQTTRKHLYVAQPFIVPQNRSNLPRSVESPIPTLTTTSRGVGLVQAFLVQAAHRGGLDRRIHDLGQPLPTQPCSNRFALVHPFFVGAGGPERAGRPKTVEDPLDTLLTRNHKALVTPLIVQTCNLGGNGIYARSVDDPLYTIVTENQLALVEPCLIEVNHGQKGHGRGQHLRMPLKTLTTKNGFGLVEPFIAKFYRDPETQLQTIYEPLHTVTTKMRHGLVWPLASRVGLDIRFRMLRPHELASAMGLEHFEFVGTVEEQVKQIGNMVEINQAIALITAILKG